MKTVTAIAQHGRIELIIRKGEEGYDEFVKVLCNIDQHGFMSWYGDVTDIDGKEQCGLIITSKFGKPLVRKPSDKPSENPPKTPIGCGE